MGLKHFIAAPVTLTIKYVDTDSTVGLQWDQDENPDEESVENIECIEKMIVSTDELNSHRCQVYQQLFATEYS